MSESELGPRQRAAETKKRRTREMIILSTLDLYGELDQGDFTRDEITAAAGVGVATLHNHFRLKYDVLRAAHERLLSPIIDPIVATHAQGTYNPPDRVAELVRYLHAVAKSSHDHRALTASMVRAFFETAPEYKPEMLATEGERDFLDKHLAGHIAAGLLPILEEEPPFSSGVTSYLDGVYSSPVTMETALYHANALLLHLYHSASSTAPIDATLTVCGQLLRATAPEVDMSELQRRLDKHRKKEELRQRLVKTTDNGRVFQMVLLCGGDLREWTDGEDESEAWGGNWSTYTENDEEILEIRIGPSSTKFQATKLALVGRELTDEGEDWGEITLRFLHVGLNPGGWMQRMNAWPER